MGRLGILALPLSFAGLETTRGHFARAPYWETPRMPRLCCFMKMRFNAGFHVYPALYVSRE